MSLIPVSELSYEAARDELVAVVATLEGGPATLEEALTLWKRGDALAKRCNDWLGDARAQVEAVIAQSAAGDTVAESTLSTD